MLQVNEAITVPQAGASAADLRTAPAAVSEARAAPVIRGPPRLRGQSRVHLLTLHCITLDICDSHGALVLFRCLLQDALCRKTVRSCICNPAATVCCKGVVAVRSFHLTVVVVIVIMLQKDNRFYASQQCSYLMLLLQAARAVQARAAAQVRISWV